MRPGAYPIFDSLRDVPRKVFSDSALVVERFLPERDGDRYVVHSYEFFGTHRLCHWKASLVPVVKGANVVERRAVPVHPEIEQQRRRLGLDFGKLDYVLHEGRPHLIDVNPTPTAASGLLSVEEADRAEARARALLDIEPLPTSLRTFPNG
jgi:hypothetical protein